MMLGMETKNSRSNYNVLLVGLPSSKLAYWE